jgi:hypothetical protein
VGERERGSRTETPFMTLGITASPVASAHFVLGSAPGIAIPTCTSREPEVEARQLERGELQQRGRLESKRQEWVSQLK